MSTRKPTQKEVDTFVSLTNCNNTTFVKNHLEKHKNDISAAVNAYFEEGLFTSYTTDPNNALAVFNKYKGNGGIMGQEGIMAFFAACQVPLEDILPVVFSCEGNAAAMGVFTQAEFTRAMVCLGLTSETDFKNKKATIRSDFVSDSAKFNRVWKYCFGYMAQGAKYVNKQLCGMMLNVIAKEKYPLTTKVVGFLNSDKVSH